MSRHNVGRRSFLIAGGVTALGTLGLVSACDSADDPANPADLGQKEAPALAEEVKAGRLPKLEERLPANPLVVQTVDRPGKYGGTWRTVAVGVEDASSWMLQTIYYDNVLAWDAAFPNNGGIADVKANLAESFTSNADGTEYVFKLRPGIKWSDGKPFTADDVVFAVNEIAVHPEVSPAPNSRFVGLDGKPGKAEKVDQYTVKITFTGPNGLFLQGMCSAGGWVLAAPMHYLQQFHGDHMSAKPADWVTAFKTKNDPFGNAERPTLTAWKVTTPIGGGSQVVVERNPYYWKVDQNRRQLPYLDKVVYSIVTDAEVGLAQVSNGQVELTSRAVNSTRNKPVLANARAKGGFDFFEVKTGQMNANTIMFNLTHADPVKRQIFGNRDFRVGLSLAINRKEIIDGVYAGQGEPWQAAPRPDSPFYDQKMAKQYTEYDVAGANAALDKAGFALKDGARVGPDGKPIEFVVLVSTSNPTIVQAMGFITRFWQAVGVKATVQSVDETLFFERVTAGQHDVAVSTGDGGDNPILYPYRYIPTAPRVSLFGPAWGTWYLSNGAQGEQPPAAVAKWIEDYKKIRGTTDATTATNLMKGILAGVRDEFQVIGTVLPIHGYGVVKNNFHNVPKSIPGDLTFPNVGAAHPEQFFVD
ncbi:ABC transporter substrate-binding protein [Catellatospora methionotrophica]|uniref:ABC transporter substrate-binding protein n=1 Tax=Catellatospora methionotrophica TaxID=121620 RepID=UPI0033F354C9